MKRGKESRILILKKFAFNIVKNYKVLMKAPKTAL